MLEIEHLPIVHWAEFDPQQRKKEREKKIMPDGIIGNIYQHKGVKNTKNVTLTCKCMSCYTVF
jgi:ribosomal protein L44E